MKKIVLFMFLAGTITLGYAQEAPKTKPDHRQAADLKLDDKQGQQMHEINRSYMKSAADIRQNDALSKEEKQKQLEVLHNERAGKIKSVLSPEQYEKWQSNQEKNKERADAYKDKKHKKEGRKEGKDGKEGNEGEEGRKQGRKAGAAKREKSEEAAKALGLSDAQGQELKSINQAFMAKAGALRDDASLTKEQRHQQLKSLNAERLEKIKLALGNDRYQQYTDWRKKERERFRTMRKKDSMDMRMKKRASTENL